MKAVLYTTNSEVTFRKRELRPCGDCMTRANRLTVGEKPLPEPMVGFGVAVTGSSAYVLDKMPENSRREYLNDIYTKDGLNCSVGRISVGSSDYSPDLYTYDDVPGDTKLEHFSVERDEEFIIPMIREILNIKPDLFLFSSPWSPPGWMKTGGSMCGGFMREEFINIYADYYVKFIKEYEKRGIKIGALTPQNECETTQDGKSVACVWHPDTEAKFVLKLRKKLEEAGLSPEIWLYDHNFSGVERLIWMFREYPELLGASGAVGWHYYGGGAEELSRLTELFPEVKMHFTEGGPRRFDHYDSDWCKWGTMMASAVNAGCRSFTGWNLLLDETGGPNVGPFDCGGLATYNTATGELSYSGQYRALKHFSGLVMPGALVLPTAVTAIDYVNMFSYPNVTKQLVTCAFKNPDGSLVLQIVNPNNSRRQMRFEYSGKKWYFELLANSVTSVVFTED